MGHFSTIREKRPVLAFKDGTFLPVSVVKKGQAPSDTRDYVDGISGGTITSKGVSDMLDDCLRPYKAYLESLSK